MAKGIPRETVVQETAKWTKWWIDERQKKLRENMSETMSINPFLLPILYEFHSLDSFEQLTDLIIAGHLMIGHSTGFGKLIDEKILPNVFGTRKLTAQYRKEHAPLQESCFDEIDHLLERSNGKTELLSLKASRWTIQLTMAVQLNHAFEQIRDKHGKKYGGVVVGVFYGTEETLTDKYKILRGINEGKIHDVVDLTAYAHVYAGRNFWAWLNNGEAATQDWVLEGIIRGLEESNCRDECAKLLAKFRKAFHDTYRGYVDKDKKVDWTRVLKDING
jgi:hypothetical protein